MKMLLLFAALCLALLPGRAQEAGVWTAPHRLEQLRQAPAALIPYPQQVQWTATRWTAAPRQLIACRRSDTAALCNALQAMQSLLEAQGVTPVLHTLVNGAAPAGAIVMGLDTALATSAEGYRLEVSGKGVKMTGKDAAGTFYAVQTFAQLLHTAGKRVQAYGCDITDAPAFSLRGFMHDTGRNFRTIASLKRDIDLLARYKYNTFHWHLTDNPAWRPESKVYPQLNDPKYRKPGRNPESGYSFNEIRELIAYARERCIRVIPELDMPGHSAYFEPTFGFKMGSAQGMDALEKLIDEFCAEIPAADCPIIHLGSDEVHIPDPEQFMRRMEARVAANGRRTMVWNPGLKAPAGTIEQLWYDMDPSELKASKDHPYVDSYAGYLNSGNALNLIQRYFFQQICGRPRGDSLALGGILCCWPDTRVDDKAKIPLHNPVWPGALTYSEAVWCGRPSYVKSYMTVLPAKHTAAWQHFAEFERRLAVHRDRFFPSMPFPFAAFSHVIMRMEGPFIRTAGQPADQAFQPEQDGPPAAGAQVLAGGVQMVNALVKHFGLPDSTHTTLYFRMEVYSETQRQAHAWIGFETPARSNRLSAGIPQAGNWDANGGHVWVNGKPLPAPAWQQPGANRFLHHTWERPGNEIPYTDEEFFWSRTPTAIPLRKGWNTVLIRVPRSYKDQSWQCAFVPVKAGPRGRWVEDLSLQFR